MTIFALLAELARYYVPERTKQRLRACRKQSIVLGKPKGVVQQSMYDADRQRILHRRALGWLRTITVDVSLNCDKLLCLRK
ncbi:hypothetical protein CDA63_15235 [Hymenobacter amundsenii]|uniref:Uncharacterized protein n=1 Tax=Hymenobacter amundsenii TaxID=2006685 RepID=A0A246FIB2_9BACT|nr:hypothetical protein CDA63_15235 [Hymenobacter amundsenii]